MHLYIYYYILLFYPIYNRQWSNKFVLQKNREHLYEVQGRETMLFNKINQNQI